MSELSSIRPNFFILGGPKCGTTAMSEYLASHPDVLFSTPKEAKYFHTDFAPAHRLAHNIDEYLSCWGEERYKYRAVGEGTVWYLYSQQAVPNILEFNPEALFLIMVRNPVELAHSLHAQLLYGGDEDVEDFELAWRLQEQRRRGYETPTYCRDPKALLYGEVAKLGKQLERLYERVARERTHVILYDDFRQDTLQVYRRVLEFLGLPDDGRVSFPVVNPSKVVHRRRVAGIVRFGAAVKRSLGIRRSFGVWRAVSSLVSRTQPRTHLNSEFRAELIEYFREDVEKLSRLVGLDLTAWLNFGKDYSGSR